MYPCTKSFFVRIPVRKIFVGPLIDLHGHPPQPGKVSILIKYRSEDSFHNFCSSCYILLYYNYIKEDSSIFVKYTKFVLDKNTYRFYDYYKEVNLLCQV